MDNGAVIVPSRLVIVQHLHCSTRLQIMNCRHNTSILLESMLEATQSLMILMDCMDTFGDCRPIRMILMDCAETKLISPSCEVTGRNISRE